MRTPNILARIVQPTDGASLAFFRAAFGLLAAAALVLDIARGAIRAHYIDPSFHFTYLGFGWVKTLPGSGMYVVAAVGAVSALVLAAGWRPRCAALVLFVVESWFLLAEKALYSDAKYLVCLIAFLFVVFANRRSPPAWCLCILRAQVAVVCFFTAWGMATGDWLHGLPIRIWFSNCETAGPLFRPSEGQVLFVWGSFFCALLIVPLLLNPRTRLPVFLFVLSLAAVLAMTTGEVYRSLLSVALATIFLPPDWPRRVAVWCRPAQAVRFAAPPPVPVPRQSGYLLFVVVYLALQVLVPLRGWLYPGRDDWTREGWNFSWRAGLISGNATSLFFVRGPKPDQVWDVSPADNLTVRQAAELGRDPDLVLQFTQRIARYYRKQAGADVTIRVNVAATLDGRPRQPFIDPQLDLVLVTRSLRATTIVLPLTTPLPDRVRGEDRQGAKRVVHLNGKFLPAK